MGQYNKTPKVHVVRKREVKRRRFYERLTTDEEIYEDSQSVAADVFKNFMLCIYLLQFFDKYSAFVGDIVE